MNKYIRYVCSLLAVVMLCPVITASAEEQRRTVHVGGMPFGLTMYTGGVIVVVGNVHDPVTYDFMEVNGKEVDIMTTFRYRNIYPMAINAIAGGKIDVKKVATNFMKFEDIQEAFEIAYKQKQTALKVVVEMPENEE